MQIILKELSLSKLLLQEVEHGKKSGQQIRPCKGEKPYLPEHGPFVQDSLAERLQRWVWAQLCAEEQPGKVMGLT